ncbi:uncharacterized protein PAN0_004d2452 [Moesziomyces antarcticus]|uniref:Uncharacterized protein n=1 Tax=Pseudozyma antarctica TaxID=84753 RepID=A0A081CC46_PSEA2|nr:uncharacterized protein PAN0_004d2452 [Moesziomyces antarcticus]GAK64242.1 hypothetical protein PAN0_004d2452 [Moesziomyces antarcticus]
MPAESSGRLDLDKESRVELRERNSRMTQAGHAKAVVCPPAPRMLWPRARSYRTAVGSETCKKTPTYKTSLREVSVTFGLAKSTPLHLKRMGASESSRNDYFIYAEVSEVTGLLGADAGGRRLHLKSVGGQNSHSLGPTSVLICYDMWAALIRIGTFVLGLEVAGRHSETATNDS